MKKVITDHITMAAVRTLLGPKRSIKGLRSMLDHAVAHQEYAQQKTAQIALLRLGPSIVLGDEGQGHGDAGTGDISHEGAQEEKDCHEDSLSAPQVGLCHVGKAGMPHYLRPPSSLLLVGRIEGPPDEAALHGSARTRTSPRGQRPIRTCSHSIMSGKGSGSSWRTPGPACSIGSTSWPMPPPVLARRR